MATIGTFKASSDGGWEGRIRTLTINVRAKFVPNDNKGSDKAPDYLVLVGLFELGAAWIHQNSETPPREYLRVQLEDPSMDRPISSALFLLPNTDRAALIWSRQRNQNCPRMT